MIALDGFTQEFAEWLCRSRKFAGLSSDALAHKIGVNRQSISQWEHGQTVPTLPNAVLLSLALGVPLPLPNRTMPLPTADASWVDDLAPAATCPACAEPLDRCLLCGGDHCTDLACEDMPRECRDDEMRWVLADEANDATREGL